MSLHGDITAVQTAPFCSVQLSRFTHGCFFYDGRCQALQIVDNTLQWFYKVTCIVTSHALESNFILLLVEKNMNPVKLQL